MIWYDNIPVGHNTLGEKMKVISIQSKLSKVYTNHCIRATCISILDEAGISDRHICGISGHKSVESLKSYKSKLSDKKKRDVLEKLCEKLVVNDTNINLPSDFTVENVSSSDIENDPVLTEFLSPSQEDKDLASVPDIEMTGEPEATINIPRSSVTKEQGNRVNQSFPSTSKSAPLPNEGRNDENSAHRSSSGMTLFSYGTVNFHYHYH